MATEEFLEHLWREVIDALSRDEAGQRHRALQALSRRRLQRRGAGDRADADRRRLEADLCLVMRCTAYEAVHGTLYALSEPGVDNDVDASALYEELGPSEPGGTDRRSGPRARAEAQVEAASRFAAAGN